VVAHLRRVGSRKDLPAVSNRSWSSVASTVTGAPFACQSGISSFRARGSKQAPERIWAPTSAPFSSTQIESALSFSLANWARRMAAASPLGPAPTITQSNSIASRSKPLLLDTPEQYPRFET
jgi:hypothetical protein